MKMLARVLRRLIERALCRGYCLSRQHATAMPVTTNAPVAYNAIGSVCWKVRSKLVNTAGAMPPPTMPANVYAMDEPA